MIVRRTLLSRGGLLAASALLGGAACQFGEPPSQSTTPTSAGAAAARTAGPAPVATSNAPLADEQVLRMALGRPVGTLDPAQVTYPEEQGVAVRLYANLLRLTAQGTLAPDLAEGLPVRSPDGLTLTFTLRRDLVYADGTPVTAQDIEYSWKRLLDPRTGSAFAFMGYALVGAEAFATASARDVAHLRELRDAVGVQTTDDRTIVFMLATPAVWFPSVLTTWCGVPLREQALAGGALAWPAAAGQLATGPYTLTSWDSGQPLVLTANPHYTGPTPGISRLELTGGTDPAASLAAYRRGDLDVLDVPLDLLPRISEDAVLQAQYQRYASGCTTYLGFNARVAPFDRPEVRRAFSLALDRPRLVKDMLGGMGVPANQLASPLSPGYFSDLRGQQLDVAQAKRLLASGAPSSSAPLAPLRLSYAATAGNLLRVEALTVQLNNALGVQVQRDPLSVAEFDALAATPENLPPLFLYGWCSDYPDPQSWYSALFHSKENNSLTGWASGQYDQLTEVADIEPDAAKRAGLYKQAAQLLITEAPAAFLYHSVVSRLVKPYVAGLTQNPLEAYLGQSSLAAVRILKH